MPSGLDEVKGRGWKLPGTNSWFARLSTEVVLSSKSFYRYKRSQCEIDIVVLHGEERERWGWKWRLGPWKTRSLSAESYHTSKKL